MTVKKVGGIRFLKIGRLNISFSVSRRREHDTIPEGRRIMKYDGPAVVRNPWPLIIIMTAVSLWLNLESCWDWSDGGLMACHGVDPFEGFEGVRVAFNQLFDN
jgi:hypothetical protein